MVIMPSEQEIYALYRGEFQQIYADLVSVIRSKPTQIIFEIEAAFCHIAVAKTTPEVAEENYAKALGHIERATLDSAKMLWLEYNRRAEKFINNQNLRKFCTNTSEASFLAAYANAENLAKNARKIEISSVGVFPGKSIDAYYEAAKKFKEVFELIDAVKVKDFKTFSIKSFLKEQGTGLVIGVISGLIAGYLLM